MRTKGESRGRSQSEVLGLVLLLGISIAGIGSVLYFGGSALTETRGNAQFQSATQSMTQFDSRVSLVAHGNANSQVVSIAGSDDASSTVHGDLAPSSGWLKVTVGDPTVSGTSKKFYLGKVVYDQDGDTVAYQGGGVWKKTGYGSTMVSPPEFQYRVAGDGSPTLTLPLVLVRGDGVDDSLEIQQASPTTQQFPTSTIPNPVRGKRVKVTVKSEYYVGWGKFFSTRTSGEVTYDHANEKVTVVLKSPPNPADIEAPVVGDGTTLSISNGGTIDAYDSRDSPPEHSGSVPDEYTSARVDGDVGSGNSFEVYGDLHVTGSATFTNTVTVHGETFVGGDTQIGNSPVFDGDFHNGGNFHLDQNSLGGKLFVGGSITEFDTNGQIADDVHVVEDVTKVTAGDMNGDLIVGGNLVEIVKNQFTVSEEIHVGGDANLGTLDSASNVVVGETATVTSDSASIGAKTLYVNDDSATAVVIEDDFTGNIVAEGDVIIQNPAGGGASVDGTIQTSGTVDVAEGSVSGDIDAGEEVYVGTSSGVGGDVRAGVAIHDPGDNIAGSDQVVSPAPSFDPREPKLPGEPESPIVNVPEAVNDAINSKGNTLQGDDNNDNDDTPACFDDAIDEIVSYPCTLTSGDYYLDRFDVDGEVNLDTSSGNINLYVDGKTYVDDNLRATADNRVQLYLNGNLETTNDGNIRIQDQKASNFWIYMRTDREANIGKSEIMAGLYGPSGGIAATEGTKISIAQNAEIWGALVGDVYDLGQIYLHYDKAFADTEAAGGGNKVPRVAFLHISTTEVNID